MAKRTHKKQSDLAIELINKIKDRWPNKIYPAWERIGIKGQRPVTMRYGIYGLDKIIGPESTVLDLGSNVGFMLHQ